MNNSREQVKVYDLKKDRILRAFAGFIAGLLAAILIASSYHRI
jgi:hypothetical protein